MLVGNRAPLPSDVFPVVTSLPPKGEKRWPETSAVHSLGDFLQETVSLLDVIRKKSQQQFYINLIFLKSLLIRILFSGDIPLHIDIRETSDSGKPIVVSQPDSPQVI